jgi:cob(I)alamin adenosyltransferase
MRRVRIYTKKGDDGTTGLLFGGRVSKASARIELNGAVDEAQATLGVARSEAGPGSELDDLLIELERQLYVLMAEVATASDNRRKLEAGTTLVSEEMVLGLERHIDDLSERVKMPEEFVIPGQNRWSAALDLARTVVRRAERLVVAATAAGELASGSLVGPYLNRLSDLLWVMARWQEGDDHVRSRQGPDRKAGPAATGFGRRPTG